MAVPHPVLAAIWAMLSKRTGEGPGLVADLFVVDGDGGLLLRRQGHLGERPRDDGGLLGGAGEVSVDQRVLVGLAEALLVLGPEGGFAAIGVGDHPISGAVGLLDERLAKGVGVDRPADGAEALLQAGVAVERVGGRARSQVVGCGEVGGERLESGGQAVADLDVLVGRLGVEQFLLHVAAIGGIGRMALRNSI
jgi:hypothetical protein